MRALILATLVLAGCGAKTGDGNAWSTGERKRLRAMCPGYTVEGSMDFDGLWWRMHDSEGRKMTLGAGCTVIWLDAASSAQRAQEGQ